MSARRLTFAFAVALALAGCLRGEGEESLAVTNAAGEPVSVVLVLEQQAGGIRVFSQEVFLETGQTLAYPLTMKPGLHVARVTTSTRIAETLLVEIPEKGDTEITVTVYPGRATLSVAST